jgi:hypothetical protein
MPAYYSLGDLSLSVGNFVETFPNISLESLACGTPSISARVATHRHVLPESIEERIDFGDTQACTEIAYKYLIEGKDAKQLERRNFIVDNFDFQTMLTSYENIIVNCRKKEPLFLREVGVPNQYKLAPWCYHSSQLGVYNDYEKEYNKDADLLKLLAQGELIRVNKYNKIVVQRYYKEGYLVIA